jgi:hypothetical protein
VFIGAFMLLSWVFVTPASDLVLDYDDLTARLATKYEEIDRERRLGEQKEQSPAPSHYDDDPPNPYWATGGYDPARFYRGAKEYGWDRLDYIRDAYGDFDSYEANRPGQD